MQKDILFDATSKIPSAKTSRQDAYLTKGYLSSTGNKLEVHTQGLLLLILHVIFCVTACAENVYT